MNTVVKCGFGVTKTFEGQKDFDVDYVEYEVVDKVVPLTNDRFSIEKEVIEHRKPISEIIQAQVDQVGIDAYMRPYQLAGISIPDVEVSEHVQDFTDFPDVDDVHVVGDNAVALFNQLDPKLRGECKTIEEFLKSMTQEKFDAYIASKNQKVEESGD